MNYSRNSRDITCGTVQKQAQTFKLTAQRRLISSRGHCQGATEVGELFLLLLAVVNSSSCVNLHSFI